MQVTEVKNRAVVFDTEAGSVTIRNNKIVEQLGFITPAEKKKMFRQYNAIIKTL